MQAEGERTPGGVRRRARPTTLLAVAGAVVAVGLVAVLFVLSQGSSQRVDVQTRSFTLTPTQATLVFVVDRAPGTRLTCDLQARDLASVIVGETGGLVVPATTERSSVVTAMVALRAPATAVEVASCVRSPG